MNKYEERISYIQNQYEEKLQRERETLKIVQENAGKMRLKHLEMLQKNHELYHGSQQMVADLQSKLSHLSKQPNLAAGESSELAQVVRILQEQLRDNTEAQKAELKGEQEYHKSLAENAERVRINLVTQINKMEVDFEQQLAEKDRIIDEMTASRGETEKSWES